MLDDNEEGKIFATLFAIQIATLMWVLSDTFRRRWFSGWKFLNFTGRDKKQPLPVSQFWAYSTANLLNVCWAQMRFIKNVENQANFPLNLFCSCFERFSRMRIAKVSNLRNWTKPTSSLSADLIKMSSYSYLYIYFC